MPFLGIGLQGTIGDTHGALTMLAREKERKAASTSNNGTGYVCCGVPSPAQLWSPVLKQKI